MEPTPFAPKRPVVAKDKDPFEAREKIEVKRAAEPVRKPDAVTGGALAAQRQVDGALYTLEFPVTCPHCEEQITTFRVFRLLRTQVSFTSTLPRKGYVIVCPECERPISSELSGLI